MNRLADIHAKKTIAYEAEIMERGDVRAVGKEQVIALTTSDFLSNEALEEKNSGLSAWEQATEVLQLTQLGVDRSSWAAFWVTEHGYLCYANEGACQCLGYSRTQLYQMNIGDIDSEWGAAKWDQWWAAVKLRGSLTLETEHQRADGTAFPVELTANYVELKGSAYLCCFARDITKTKQAEVEWRHQQERERLVGAIATKIRQSLNLPEILQTTVDEVRQLLLTDRVLIFKFNPDWTGTVKVESVGQSSFSILEEIIYDPCFSEEYVRQYQEGRVRAITDIHSDGLDECHVKFLSQFQVRANLVVPILFNQELNITTNQQQLLDHQFSGYNVANSQLWGLLIAHHCQETRQWHEWEMDLLKQLATHAAIAIQQSTLFERLQLANRELELLATSDSLTGVANRRMFDEHLNREWRRMMREESWLSLILCDIDYFKRYNDNYGHQAGDACLQRVATAIRDAVRRPGDLVARYGGEEFAVILPNTNRTGALQVAEAIRMSVRDLGIPHCASGVAWMVTLSLGAATAFPSPNGEPEMLIAAADQALYEAKAKGRDRLAHSTLQRR
ncbi:MAG TPA: diguanylate cyclase [Oscillatoriaceae cyanobacterium M33_DOE_052]|uniref:Diguanylate cyclase n=1 Tax=Planktothricoides sp. SpSt-374 TaxID=2282167 RepID=A0A7C3ZYE8_9CYAN|nr:diguanylate cyclase [Oscillatoriaceae cyanobacterium M33_DOE_052]